MSRVVLFHWSPETARRGAKRLRDGGHRVELLSPAGPESLRAVIAKPPDLFVLDCARSPSRAGDFASYLRRRRATRHVPIVFAGGAPDRIARLRRLLPDAVYAEWSRIRSAVGRAAGRRVEDPAVPDPMAGYSATPLPRKLGIKAGAAVALLGAPAGFERRLGSPRDVRVRRRAQGPADRVLLFARSRGDLVRRFPGAARALAEGGGLWLIWPKKASGVKTDLSQADVRAFGLDAGFVDYKICAVDDTWSGLLFARRRKTGSRAEGG